MRAVLQDDQQDQGDDRREEVADGAGESDEDVVAHVVLEVASGDGRGLGPAEEGTTVDQCDDREEDGSEKVEVLQGVEGDATECQGGGIAEAIGGPGVGALMDAEGEHQDHDLEEDDDDFLVHISFKSTGVGAKEP